MSGGRPPVKITLLDDIGIDGICEMISDCIPMHDIARKCKVSWGTLSAWIKIDPERSARVKEVREDTARYYDELALAGILEAKDPFELAKAREAAHHLRWRSSKIAPKEYGEKITQDITTKLTWESVIVESLGQVIEAQSE